MPLHGENMIGRSRSGVPDRGFQAVNPATGQDLPPVYAGATTDEVDRALRLAAAACDRLRATTPAARARFLDAIADRLLALGDELLERAQQETGLPRGRLESERLRTVNQARLFASVVREGSWCDARIDHADPQRQPLPKPDVRRMLAPLGPVAVFGSGNFPLAIGAAGTDTVSALAAGCPVVAKSHSGHPGTSELAGQAILAAADDAGMPEGVFSLLFGGHSVGQQIVQHPATAAVAFTGSLRGGRALFDLAARRPRPIPVFAEMGSVNPVFLLPEALAQRGPAIADAFVKSMTLGVGQFCTKPGVVCAIAGPAFEQFAAAAAGALRQVPAATMLNAAIRDAYNAGAEHCRAAPGVQVLARVADGGAGGATAGLPELFRTDAGAFLAQAALREEVFGPTALLVACADRAAMLEVARCFEGQLAAAVHATPGELSQYGDLLAILERWAGRIIANGFPTGIEVCHAMHHGGPYPATTFAQFTSIGTAAMLRFVRPVCYQDFPDSALPEPVREANPRGVWRLVDGRVAGGKG